MFYAVVYIGSSIQSMPMQAHARCAARTIYKQLCIVMRTYLDLLYILFTQGEWVKRSKLLRRLEKLGFEIKKGGKHTDIFKNGKRLSTLFKVKKN